MSTKSEPPRPESKGDKKCEILLRDQVKESRASAFFAEMPSLSSDLRLIKRPNGFAPKAIVEETGESCWVETRQARLPELLSVPCSSRKTQGPIFVRSIRVAASVILAVL